jgi:hypothetical protein
MVQLGGRIEVCVAGNLATVRADGGPRSHRGGSHLDGDELVFETDKT